MPSASLDSVRAARNRFWSNVRKTSRCWWWEGGRTGDYGAISIDNASQRAHRVSWMLRHDELIPDGMLVLHKCDNELCVRPGHLYLGTHSDNAKDRTDRNRTQIKLTPEQVQEIRSRFRSHRAVKRLGLRSIRRRPGLREIADEFGVSISTVSRLVNGKTKTYEGR